MGQKRQGNRAVDLAVWGQAASRLECLHGCAGGVAKQPIGQRQPRRSPARSASLGLVAPASWWRAGWAVALSAAARGRPPGSASESSGSPSEPPPLRRQLHRWFPPAGQCRSWKARPRSCWSPFSDYRAAGVLGPHRVGERVAVVAQRRDLAIAAHPVHRHGDLLVVGRVLHKGLKGSRYCHRAARARRVISADLSSTDDSISRVVAPLAAAPATTPGRHPDLRAAGDRHRLGHPRSTPTRSSHRPYRRLEPSASCLTAVSPPSPTGKKTPSSIRVPSGDQSTWKYRRASVGGLFGSGIGLAWLQHAWSPACASHDPDAGGRLILADHKAGGRVEEI